MCRKEAGERKKRNRAGRRWEGERDPLACYFSILTIFIGIPSISFRGGESMRDASLGKAMRAARGLKRTKEQCLVFLFNTNAFLSNLYQERMKISSSIDLLVLFEVQ